LLSYIREDAQRSHFIPILRDLCVIGGKLFPVEFFFKKGLVTKLLRLVISDRAAHRTAWQHRACLEHLCLPRCSAAKARSAFLSAFELFLISPLACQAVALAEVGHFVTRHSFSSCAASTPKAPARESLRSLGVDRAHLLAARKR
jgi:hypothetical protein